MEELKTLCESNKYKQFFEVRVTFTISTHFSVLRCVRLTHFVLWALMNRFRASDTLHGLLLFVGVSSSPRHDQYIAGWIFADTGAKDLQISSAISG